MAASLLHILMRMSERNYSYVIVGGGLAGASAVEGIRERDAMGSILLMAEEEHLPYDRPPLTKKLWFGKKQLSDIVLHGAAFYASEEVEVALGARATRIDRARHLISDSNGNEYGYGKLLLATGAVPRRLSIPGGEGEGVQYFRTVDDYTSLRAQAQAGRAALVIGGGFIGSELAAALCQNGVEVTLLFPGFYLCERIFPASLAAAVEARYRERGIRIVAQDRAVSIARQADGFVTRTAAGQVLESDMVVAGVGIDPAAELARDAGLLLDNGIVVNDLLQSSDPDIYAAGDNASFRYMALGRRMRVEHWDNARAQGRQAGANMAGAATAYDYMPYFFSDLFELGYEAVGEIDSRLNTTAEWEQEHEYEKGMIYYSRDGRVRGVMACNLWDKLDDARALIRGAPRRAAEPIRGGPVQPNP